MYEYELERTLDAVEAQNSLDYYNNLANEIKMEETY